MKAKDFTLKVVNEIGEGKFETKEFKPYMSYESFVGCIVPDAEILRPTGLKDKNYKEIYEGNICKDDTGTIVEIVWVEDKFQFGAKVLKGCILSQDLTFPLWQWNNCKENGFRQLEVICNIYEKRMITDERI